MAGQETFFFFIYLLQRRSCLLDKQPPAGWWLIETSSNGAWKAPFLLPSIEVVVGFRSSTQPTPLPL